MRLRHAALASAVAALLAACSGEPVSPNAAVRAPGSGTANVVAAPLPDSATATPQNSGMIGNGNRDSTTTFIPTP